MKALVNLDCRIALGPDGIPGIFWRSCANSLYKPITYLFNESLRSGTFPQCFKNANITPIFKNGNPSLPQNYRPISLLSILAKVFEKVVYDALYFHVKSTLCHEQHGFLPGRCVTTNLVNLVHDVSDALDQKMELDVIYTDLTKAFDRINHNFLLHKLTSYGFCGGVLSWLTSYLLNRSQRVVYKGCHSDWKTVLSGVPQGSLLGPLLFTIYMNDLPGVVGSSRVLMYADDVKIYKRICGPGDCEALQRDVNLVSDWFRRWDLSLNIQKCQTITFSRKRSSRSTDYFINNNKVSRVLQIKDLGVLFTTDLNFTPHINIAVRRAFRCIGFIKRQTHLFTSMPAIKCLYTTLVMPILEYASQVWNTNAKTNSGNLERVQRKFVRFLCLKKKMEYNSSDYESVCKSIGLTPLHLRRKVLDLVFFKKVISGEIDSRLLVDSLHIRVPRTGSRLKNTFYIPRSRTSLHQNLHTMYRMSRTYNEIVNEPEMPDIYSSSLQKFRLNTTKVLKSAMEQ